MRALVIDDSRSMRAILSRILRQLGVDVAEAADGQAALDWLSSGERADFAFVDWHMPNMDGIAFVSAVRNRPDDLRSLPIMMVSTESDTEYIVKALSAGANEYMMKPFTPEAVSEKLNLLGLSDSGTHESADSHDQQEQHSMEVVIPSVSTIREIVQEVWSSILEDPGHLVPEQDLLLPADAVLAFIEITGSWNGSVRVACSLTAARHIAAGMFAKDEGDVEDDELSDAVGEFTNIVGGNLKALFPTPCSLSLPGVAGMGAFADTVPPGLPVDDEASKLTEVKFSWQFEPLVVSLWEGSST